jgi:NAD(P)-dependent dehydrogenase (short-subunit alcohol dehydrogenase family)
VNRLLGKVVVVTGGNAGIGEAVAKRVAAEGGLVVITGRRRAELERVVREIEANGGRALEISGSVTDELHVKDTVAKALKTFGRIDGLVNNAGIGNFGKRIHDMDDATWANVMDVNVTGILRMTRAVVPQMLKQGNGSIVNISSIASVVGIPALPAYAASKGAIDALTRAIAVDYAQDGIRCNVVNPGLIDTPMAAPLMANPEQLAPILTHYLLKRPGKPDEVASMVLHLLSDEAAWVTGATFMIDGGMTAW